MKSWEVKIILFSNSWEMHTKMGRYLILTLEHPGWLAPKMCTPWRVEWASLPYQAVPESSHSSPLILYPTRSDPATVLLIRTGRLAFSTSIPPFHIRFSVSLRSWYSPGNMTSVTRLWMIWVSSPQVTIPSSKIGIKQSALVLDVLDWESTVVVKRQVTEFR